MYVRQIDCANLKDLLLVQFEDSSGSRNNGLSLSQICSLPIRRADAYHSAMSHRKSARLAASHI
jgi:hypothetical protein